MTRYINSTEIRTLATTFYSEKGDAFNNAAARIKNINAVYDLNSPSMAVGQLVHDAASRNILPFLAELAIQILETRIGDAITENSIIGEENLYETLNNDLATLNDIKNRYSEPAQNQSARR